MTRVYEQEWIDRLKYDTVESFLEKRHPELLEEYERYAYIMSLEAENASISKTRRDSFAFDVGIIEVSVALLIGIVGNMLSELIKKARAKKIDDCTHSSDGDVKELLDSVDMKHIIKIKYKHKRMLDDNHLISELVEYSFLLWNNDE